jgi:putative endonuclease
MQKPGCVYILTNKPRGTLYTGVTSNLVQRVYWHRKGVVEGFTKRYNLKKLVYFEKHDQIQDAILREKRIKEWKRAWKVRLIEENNPEWRDLYPEIASTY